MSLKRILKHKIYDQNISKIDIENSYVINTVNAHSYCMMIKDDKFAKVLERSDVLLPDGISIVMAAKFLLNKKIKKIAGADIHEYLLEKAHRNKGKVFYLGSSSDTLKNIEQRIIKDFPNIKVASYSPPFSLNFTKKENVDMISSINQFKPTILFVGMTAPKQEKWVDANKHNIEVPIIVSIGAVFDFYAGTVNRAPRWMLNSGFEWLYRLIKEPKRMWRRYLVNNNIFMFHLLKEKFLK